MKRFTPILLAAASLAALAVALFAPRAAPAASAATTFPVQVADSTTGQPVPGAALSPIRAGSGPQLVRVSAPGYEERTVALAPGQHAVVPLLRSAPGSVSLMFGGDTMMGRRFYDPGAGQQPLLTRSSGVPAHKRLLAPIAPLLGNADVTAVNLEGPLLANPIVPADRHGFLTAKPGSNLLFASSTALAAALKQSGVDVVGLNNNHLYDALQPGVQSTLAALDRAGIAHFGGGLNEAQAWRPAYVHVRGQTVAFVGCTTVTGYGTDPATDQGDAPAGDTSQSNVAGPHKGGAAECDPGQLAAAVRQARQHADVVTAVIHGGFEYQRAPSPVIRGLATAAARAGAAIVVGGHPHVVGGITTIGTVPFVESAGNLVFDQTLWQPQLSYLTRFDVTSGKVARTSVDPFVLSNFTPVPVVGPEADAAARLAAGVPGSPLVLGEGSAAGPRTPGAAGSEPVGGQPGTIVGLPAGGVLPARTSGAGTDLLWGTGSFERFTTGGQPPGTLWTLGQARLTANAACAGSSYGAQLLRSPLSHGYAVITPRYRVPVTAGEQLSLVASVKAASSGASLTLRWYNTMTGHSVSQNTVAIPTQRSASACHQVRLNVTVPPGAAAAKPYVRLAPSGAVHARTRLWVDDVRLVAFNVPPGQPALGDVVDLGRTHPPVMVTQSRVR